MGEVVRNPTGGFQVSRIDEFDVRTSAGIVSMFPFNGDQQSGPGVVLSAEGFSALVNLDTAVSGLIKNEPAYSFSEPGIIMIDGVQGRSLDFTTIYHALDGIILENPGAAEGESIRGRVIMVVIEKTRLFKCLMLSPEKSWGMYEPIFNTLITSISFFPTE